MSKLRLLSAVEVQDALRERQEPRRRALKLSRAALAEPGTVPTPTIKRCETSAQISPRQFLLLRQCVDDLARLQALTGPTESPLDRLPTSIDEVLAG